MVGTPGPQGWPRDMYLVELEIICGLPWWLRGKESACNTGDLGSIPGLGDTLEEGRATHCSTLAWSNPMGRGGWWDIVHRVTQGHTELDMTKVTKQQKLHGQNWMATPLHVGSILFSLNLFSPRSQCDLLQLQIWLYDGLTKSFQWLRS